MTYYKRLVVSIVISMSTAGIHTAWAQQSPIPDPFAKLSAPSPTTAALAKITDIPSSGFTGSPEIGIPLYEINTSFVKLPISLTYQGGGVTVDQESSNVGLGWSLNAGGILSRSVLGSVDNGTYQTYRMNRQTSFTINNPIDYRQAPLLLSGDIDGVPDLYIYNLPGYSGKFIIADQVRQLPMTNLQIVKVSENEFNITTPDGNKYIFSTPEVSRNSSETSKPYNTVGWYLTKILSADRTDSVTLSYANTNYVSGGGRSFTRSFYQGVGGAWDGSEYAESVFSNSINGKQLTK